MQQVVQHPLYQKDPIQVSLPPTESREEHTIRHALAMLSADTSQSGAGGGRIEAPLSLAKLPDVFHTPFHLHASHPSQAITNHLMTVLPEAPKKPAAGAIGKGGKKKASKAKRRGAGGDMQE